MTKENCILWVKWKQAWPESRQDNWEQAGSGDDDPNGWLLSERLKEIEEYIYEWKIESYSTFGESLKAAFANPITWDEVRCSTRSAKK